MHTMVQMKQVFLAGAAAVGGAFVALFGSNPVLVRALLVFMAADYISGVLVAALFKRSGKSESGALSSQAGLLGLARKAGMLLMLLVANQLGAVLETPYIEASLCLFLLQNEGLSILENLGLMGVPYPDFLRKALDTLLKKPD